MNAPLFAAPIPTADGTFVARYTETGLAALDFPSARAAQHARASLPEKIRVWHALTTTALQNVLAGKRVGKLPPLDVASATTFQQEVWGALRKIPSGKTRSYLQVAKAIGRPAAVRAVGSACGANRIPVLIPCHRALTSNGGLGGFSGGLDWKRKLLQREGVSV